MYVVAALIVAGWACPLRTKLIISIAITYNRDHCRPLRTQPTKAEVQHEHHRRASSQRRELRRFLHKEGAAPTPRAQGRGAGLHGRSPEPLRPARLEGGR